MKQLGNLALVCANRSDVLLQIQRGTVCFSIGIGTQMETITALVRELNFGRYQNTENGGYTHD